MAKKQMLGDPLFLEKLQKEAAFQGELYSTRLLPKKADAVTAYIGTHVWQVIGSLALITALLLEIIEKM
ncbi:MAG: hypothetical protein H6773_04570 [Pseudomonadales bacterium]|nr:hypothetical protein [Candidatus Woesebacteria bacterium]MCB9801431.1 hypothetical protein [Pseudomonadales bacterium]